MFYDEFYNADVYLHKYIENAHTDTINEGIMDGFGLLRGYNFISKTLKEPFSLIS
jgi:hypothetical protein